MRVSSTEFSTDACTGAGCHRPRHIITFLRRGSRAGIAGQLLDQVKAWTVSEGATTLSLGVPEGNEQALTAYLNMGLRVSETVPEVGHPTKVIVVLQCDLGPQ